MTMQGRSSISGLPEKALTMGSESARSGIHSHVLTKSVDSQMEPHAHTITAPHFLSSKCGYALLSPNVSPHFRLSLIRWPPHLLLLLLPPPSQKCLLLLFLHPSSTGKSSCNGFMDMAAPSCWSPRMAKLSVTSLSLISVIRFSSEETRHHFKGSVTHKKDPGGAVTRLFLI